MIIITVDNLHLDIDNHVDLSVANSLEDTACVRDLSEEPRAHHPSQTFSRRTPPPSTREDKENAKIFLHLLTRVVISPSHVNSRTVSKSVQKTFVKL